MLILYVFVCFYAFISFCMVEYIIEGKITLRFKRECISEKLQRQT